MIVWNNPSIYSYPVQKYDKYMKHFLTFWYDLLLVSIMCMALGLQLNAKNLPQKQPLELFCKKNLILKILQYSQENTCVGVSFW